MDVPSPSGPRRCCAKATAGSNDITGVSVTAWIHSPLLYPLLQNASHRQPWLPSLNQLTGGIASDDSALVSLNDFHTGGR